MDDLQGFAQMLNWYEQMAERLTQQWIGLYPLLVKLDNGLMERWVPLTLLVSSVAGGLLVVLAAVIGRRKYARVRWGNKMTQPQREAALRHLLGDLIVDAFEEAEYKGLVKRHEINMWYQRLSVLFDIPDFLPQRDVFDPLTKTTVKECGRTLKEQMKDRLARKVHAPVKLPDDGSAPVVKLKDHFRKRPAESSKSA